MFRSFLYIFIITASFLSAPNAHAALLYLDPSSGEYGAGDTFIVKVRIDNEEECINTAQVQLQFPTNLLKAVDFSRGGSILTLWIGEPEINNNKGLVSFSGGIPAGYCGRIKGDPALSNLLGKIIFNVPAKVATYKYAQEASIRILPQSQVFLNDGLGTSAETTMQNTKLVLSPASSFLPNEWLEEVRADKTPPELFKIRIQRTSEIYDEKYYAVFSTTDKQSGLDHFEIFEKGVWKYVQSPYKLKDQSLSNEIKVRAIDKSGNETLGEYVSGDLPPLPNTPVSATVVFIVIVIGISGVIAIRMYSSTQKKPNE